MEPRQGAGDEKVTGWRGSRSARSSAGLGSRKYFQPGRLDYSDRRSVTVAVELSRPRAEFSAIGRTTTVLKVIRASAGHAASEAEDPGLLFAAGFPFSFSYLAKQFLFLFRQLLGENDL